MERKTERKLEEFVNKMELAQFFKVSSSTIDGWVRNGLPGYRIGRRLYFLPDEVFEFLVAQKRESMT